MSCWNNLPHEAKIAESLTHKRFTRRLFLTHMVKISKFWKTSLKQLVITSRSYLGLLNSDPIEVSDDEDNTQLQNAIANSLQDQQT